MPLKIHREGPGLKVLGTERWFGSGYCGVCGESSRELIVARCVRFWSPDDGWKVGILCIYCAPEVAKRGPQPEDFAVKVLEDKSERIDVVAAEIGDYDALSSCT